MRAAGFVLLLAACSGKSSSSAAVDASVDAWRDLQPCVSPAGTASITATHANLQPQYARMYAGGVFAGVGDCGGVPNFSLRPFFTNEALTTVQDVIECETGTTCATVGVFVDVFFLRGDELGVHAAQIRDSTSTWKATGTVTLTDLVYPENNSVGHVAGSIHLDSTTPQVAIDGTFDHTFCPGLLGTVL